MFGLQGKRTFETSERARPKKYTRLPETDMAHYCAIRGPFRTNKNMPIRLIPDRPGVRV